MVVDTLPTKQLLLDYAEATVCISVWLCDRVKLACQQHNCPASAPHRQHSGLSPAALDWLHKDPFNISDVVCLCDCIYIHMHLSKRRGLYDSLLPCRVLLGAISHLWHSQQNIQQAKLSQSEGTNYKAMGGKHNQRQHVSHRNPSSRHNWKYKQLLNISNLLCCVNFFCNK